jgi:hypothetical protein
MLSQQQHQLQKEQQQQQQQQQHSSVRPRLYWNPLACDRGKKEVPI